MLVYQVQCVDADTTGQGLAREDGSAATGMLCKKEWYSRLIICKRRETQIIGVNMSVETKVSEK